jgi:hypothetical protein
MEFESEERLEPAFISQLQCRLAMEVKLAKAVLNLQDKAAEDVTVGWKDAALELASTVVAHEAVLGPMLDVLTEMLDPELSDLDVN